MTHRLTNLHITETNILITDIAEQLLINAINRLVIITIFTVIVSASIAYHKNFYKMSQRFVSITEEAYD